MAIFHFSAKVVSRGKGQSSVAKAAYNSRAQLTNERTGEAHDYTRAEGLVFSGIFAPKDAPDWVHDRERLWSEVEATEKRKDAQLAREVEIALPHELTDEQRRQLITDFTRENFVRQGMVADVAIHAPDREGDTRNHHAHILLTMREIGPDGFGPKMRKLNSKAQLQEWRQNWERTANRYLERYGHEARIDHRSLTDQGIDREPTEHLGPAASEHEREGKQTERGDINREIEERNRQRENLQMELRAVGLELADAERTAQAERPAWQQEAENGLTDEERKRKIKPKKREPYSQAGMVPTQQDAQRDFKKRMKKLEARFEQEQEQKRRGQVEQKRKEEKKSSFADRKTDAEQKREEAADRKEMTAADRARAERDALREKYGLRTSSEKQREEGRERERERER